VQLISFVFLNLLTALIYIYIYTVYIFIFVWLIYISVDSIYTVQLLSSEATVVVFKSITQVMILEINQYMLCCFAPVFSKKECKSMSAKEQYELQQGLLFCCCVTVGHIQNKIKGSQTLHQQRKQAP